jgi:hypothetical protein
MCDVTANRSTLATVPLAAGSGILALDLAVQFQAYAGPWHLVLLAPLERPSRAALLFAAGIVLLAAPTWLAQGWRTPARVLTVLAGVLAPLALTTTSPCPGPTATRTKG